MRPAREVARLGAQEAGWGRCGPLVPAGVVVHRDRRAVCAWRGDRSLLSNAVAGRCAGLSALAGEDGGARQCQHDDFWCRVQEGRLFGSGEWGSSPSLSSDGAVLQCDGDGMIDGGGRWGDRFVLLGWASIYLRPQSPCGDLPRYTGSGANPLWATFCGTGERRRSAPLTAPCCMSPCAQALLRPSLPALPPVESGRWMMAQTRKGGMPRVQGWLTQPRVGIGERSLYGSKQPDPRTRQ